MVFNAQSSNVVYIDYVINSQRVARRSNEKWLDTKDPYSKPSEKDNYTFFKHINRADGLEKQIWSGKICGTKSRGRQCSKYTDSLNNFVTRKESPNHECIRRTDDRMSWKAVIADVCNRPGT